MLLLPEKLGLEIRPQSWILHSNKGALFYRWRNQCWETWYDLIMVSKVNDYQIPKMNPGTDSQVWWQCLNLKTKWGAVGRPCSISAPYPTPGLVGPPPSEAGKMVEMWHMDQQKLHQLKSSQPEPLHQLGVFYWQQVADKYENDPE